MIFKNIAVIFLLAIFNVATANADQRLTFGVKLLGAEWKGDNAAGGSDFNSDKGGQFALNVSYKINDFYAGLNLQKGEYDFKENAPDRFTILGRFPSSNVIVEQTDIDLLFGYYFWKQVSIFADIKSLTNDWQNEPYQQKFVGLGLGTSGYIPINDRWTLFGSLGFIGENDLKDNDDRKVGKGKSWALEMGTVYSINDRHFINAGIKTRNYEFESLDATKQEYKINAIFIGYNFSLLL